LTIVFSRVDDHKSAVIQRQGCGRAVLPSIEEIKGLSVVLLILLFGRFPTPMVGGKVWQAARIATANRQVNGFGKTAMVIPKKNRASHPAKGQLAQFHLLPDVTPSYRYVTPSF